MKILIADDSSTNREILTIALHHLGHKVMAAKNGKEAIEMFQQNRPDLIILDVVMDSLNGYECAKKIRSINTEDWIPIIFLSSSIDDASIAKGIDAGGDDYLAKPFSEITLSAKIKAMQRIADMRNKLYELTEKLKILSITDPLTKVYNRLYFNTKLPEVMEKADQNNTLVALLFLDLDKFKLVNDTFGHHIGDKLLIEVTHRIQSCLRANDFIARIGGDEFAIIIDSIEQVDDVEQVVKKIISYVSKEYYLDGMFVQVGISIGIAIYPIYSTTKTNLVQNADVAMYRAKSLGCNNYVFFKSGEMTDS